MKNKSTAIILILLFLFAGAGILVIARNNQETDDKTEEAEVKVSKKADIIDNAPKKPAGLEQYNNKIIYYSTSDGKVKGTAGIKYFMNSLDVVFNFYFVENFSRQQRYVGKLLIANDATNLSAGIVSPGWEDKPKINDPFVIYWTDVYKNRGFRGDLDAFYLAMKYSTKSGESLMDAKELVIYQANNSSDYDLKKIMASGSKIRTYKLDVKETTLDKLTTEIKTK